MPRLPPTANSMDAGEPSLGRFVLDADRQSGAPEDREGMVVEIKTGGWRTILSANGVTSSKRSGSLEYVVDLNPPPASRGTVQVLLEDR